MDFQIWLEFRAPHYLSKPEKQFPARKFALDSAEQLVQFSPPPGTFGLFLSPLGQKGLLNAEAPVCPPVVTQTSLAGAGAGFS